MRPAEVIRRGEAYLERHGVGSALVEAETLMQHVLGLGRAEVYLRPEGLTSAQARAYGRALCRRCSGAPLQHVTGTVAFRGLRLEARPGVFVPRPETEVTAEVALGAIAGVGGPRVVDAGTGSGAIALAIAHERPDALVWATDRSPDAVTLARANAAKLGLPVTVLEGDLLAPLPEAIRERVDLVVCNPPYVPRERERELPPEVLAEPPHALFGDPGFAGRVLEEAVGWLGSGGAVVIEIEESTAGEVTRRATGAGLIDVGVRRDLAGRDRVVVARRP